MSKALIFAALLAGLPAAAYAQDTRDNPVNAGAAAGAAVGAAATAPLAAAARNRWRPDGRRGAEIPPLCHRGANSVLHVAGPSACRRRRRATAVGCDALSGSSGIWRDPLRIYHRRQRAGAGRPVEPSDRRGRTVGSPAPKSKDGWKQERPLSPAFLEASCGSSGDAGASWVRSQGRRSPANITGLHTGDGLAKAGLTYD
jgi:hypothetical protein